MAVAEQVAEQGLFINRLPRKAFQKLCFEDRLLFNSIRHLLPFKLLTKAKSGRCSYQMYNPYTDEQTSCVLTLQLSPVCLYKHHRRHDKTGKIFSPPCCLCPHPHFTPVYISPANGIISHDCSLIWQRTQHLISVPLMYTGACFGVRSKWTSAISHIPICPQWQETMFLPAGSPTLSIFLFCASTQHLLPEMFQ